MESTKNQKQAFSAGHKLWILADLESSAWAKKLDWYLNFQLRRASLHQPKKISESTQEKIASWGVDLTSLTKSVKKIDINHAPLMVATHKLLPNSLTIQIPFKDISGWVRDCMKVLKDLGQTDARVFLPAKVSASEFSKALKSDNFNFEMIEESALD